MTNRLGLLVVAPVLGGITVGCSAPPTMLPGAYFKIPVYQPSTVEDSMGGLNLWLSEPKQDKPRWRTSSNLRSTR